MPTVPKINARARTALGLCVFRSNSSQADSNSPRGACKGFIFALEVAEELHEWPEQDTHGRQAVTSLLGVCQQVTPADAWRYEWMREALSALPGRLPAAATEPELNERAGMYMMMKEAATYRGASSGALLINVTYLHEHDECLTASSEFSFVLHLQMLPGDDGV
ncbi:hypothetical protein EJB05_38237, partial [Eragrostis curvula]